MVEYLFGKVMVGKIFSIVQLHRSFSGQEEKEWTALGVITNINTKSLLISVLVAVWTEGGQKERGRRERKEKGNLELV